MSKSSKNQIYYFRQNNSGGRYHYDSQVTEKIFIEAASSDEANKIAESIGIYFDGVSSDNDCSCCGDRWSRASYDDTIDDEYKYGVNLPFDGETKMEYIFRVIQEKVQHSTTDKDKIKYPIARLFLKNGKIHEFFK